MNFFLPKETKLCTLQPLMFYQQADTNSKSLLCLHRKAHSATYEAVGDMPPPSGAQQSMILISSAGFFPHNSGHME